MNTINVDNLFIENKRLGRIINDLGELIGRESSKLYSEVVMSNFNSTNFANFTKNLSQEDEKNFLIKLYHCMIDKLKEIHFD